MYQQALFEDDQLTRVVNVASVPQRSPFRYPGGKTWLVPHVRKWLWSKEKRPTELIEPFGGGGIIGLTAAAENLAKHVTLVELDDEVAAVWHTLLGRDASWLANRILSVKLSREYLERELQRKPRSTREKAFQTILKNRTFHGGILAPGSRPLNYGENGKGILSRWYPATLARRIVNIAAIRDRVSFVEGDGIEVIRRASSRPSVAFFIDPPYTADGKRAGTRLYKHCDLDHKRLFQTVSEVRGDFLMTYDDAPGVRVLAENHGFDIEVVRMKNTHHEKMKELLVGRNLIWARPRVNATAAGAA
ncbi:MAG TPA: DNA adenine methylase [Candidatus Acidoferrales bacterium]|nr:DNA adenine methylase [Candidatus Acidoferrales bacterium]